ncbi:MAG: class I SAM-dependent methyltransferase, partial [Candidatus Schekmanbacteria bacterium]
MFSNFKGLQGDSFYRCIKCSEAVKFLNGRFFCPSCQKDWGSNGRYPDFIDDDFYWGEIPRDYMKEVCEYAKKNGWIEALEKKIRKVNPNIYRYVMSCNRADWRVLLNLDENSVVLDLGAGWGTISSILSDFVGKVYALESIKERVDFIDIRKEQDNKNIYPVRADFNDPPFFNESFDLIVCNGVLEWVALNKFDGSPRKVQIDFLKRLYKLLKPKGTLYIGIENRFSYESFNGAIDHSGLPYTNLLPRFLADIVVRLNALVKLKTKNFFLSKRLG